MWHELRRWLIGILGAVPNEEFGARLASASRASREELHERLARYWKAINPLLERRASDATDAAQFERWRIAEETDILHALVQDERDRVDYMLRLVRAEFDGGLRHVRRALLPDAPDDAA